MTPIRLTGKINNNEATVTAGSITETAHVTGAFDVFALIWLVLLEEMPPEEHSKHRRNIFMLCRKYGRRMWQKKEIDTLITHRKI